MKVAKRQVNSQIIPILANEGEHILMFGFMVGSGIGGNGHMVIGGAGHQVRMVVFIYIMLHRGIKSMDRLT